MDRWKCDVANGCRRGDGGGTHRYDRALSSSCPAVVGWSSIASAMLSATSGRRRLSAVFGVRRLRHHRGATRSSSSVSIPPDTCTFSFRRTARQRSLCQAGAIRSILSKNERDELMNSVSSAYSTSNGNLESAGGRVRSRDRRSRSATSR